MKLLTLAGIVFAWPLLCADNSGQPEPRLLDLNVIAVDNHGKAVTDLTADDFQISDAGKPQKISFFRINQTNHTGQIAPLGPNEFSNRVSGESRGATVVIFDLLNLGFGARGIATNQLQRELPQIEAADSLYMYVVSVDGAVFPVHDVQPPEKPLVEPSSGPWTRQAKPLLDNVLKAVTRVRSVDIDVYVRTLLTFHALETVGSRVAAIPGRKNVIWVTDGVPLALGEIRSDTGEPVDFTPEIRKLSESLDRSYISLYPVRQIMMGRSDNIGATSDGSGATGGAGTGISEIATLELLAGLTGGHSSEKDIGAAIQEVSRNLNFSYQIGYYAPSGNWDNKFHKLRVTSKRKGLRIQAKTGYYAWKVAEGSRAGDAFTATANAPLDAAEIGLRASVSPDTEHHNGATLTVRVHAQDLSLVPEGDHFTDQIRVMTIAYLPAGPAAVGPPRPLDIQFTAAQRDQALKDGISFTENLAPAQGATKFRVIVFDRGSNGVGSITIPVEKLQAQR